MLEPESVTLARKRIAIELAERREAFRREASRIKGEMAARGALYSSMTLGRLSDAISREFEVRAFLAWQIVSRVISAQPEALSDDVAGQAKAEVLRVLYAECDDLSAEHAFGTSLIKGMQGMRPLDQCREPAKGKIESEIDLSLMAARNRQPGGHANTVNIYQPYGIVQTGDGATATFNQQIGATERQELDRALAAVDEVLGRPGVLSEGHVPATRAVVADLRAEVAKPEPNVPRIRGALMAIATSIQALGSAAPAYAILKGAAALLGVHLP